MSHNPIPFWSSAAEKEANPAVEVPTVLLFTTLIMANIAPIRATEAKGIPTASGTATGFNYLWQVELHPSPLYWLPSSQV